MPAESNFKDRMHKMLQTCQGELKRTTEIGKRMLTASKTNTKLHESYEELGLMVAKALCSGELKWDNPRVHEILSEIKSCEKDLESIEEEVNTIRFSDQPEFQSEQSGAPKEE